MGHLNPRVWVPAHCAHLVGWFWDLSSARQSGMSGPQPLSWSDMSAWSQYTGNTPHPHEWEILRAMDREFLTASAREASEQDERQRAAQKRTDSRYGG